MLRQFVKNVFALALLIHASIKQMNVMITVYCHDYRITMAEPIRRPVIGLFNYIYTILLYTPHYLCIYMSHHQTMNGFAILKSKTVKCFQNLKLICSVFNFSSNRDDLVSDSISLLQHKNVARTVTYKYARNLVNINLQFPFVMPTIHK